MGQVTLTTHAHFGLFAMPRLLLDLTYPDTKFEDYTYILSKDMEEEPKRNKNSSGDEIANVNFSTTISYM